MSSRAKVPFEFWVYVLSFFMAITGIGLAVAALWPNPEVVVGKVTVLVKDEPISRWYVEVERDGSRRLAEVGPALYDCFEVGDEYSDGSLGRCVGVVWP